MSIAKIDNLPDVSFIDDITLEEIQSQLVSDYEARYTELTGGKTVTLQRADPPALILYACSAILYQLYLFVDRAGKQDLLKYSYGEFLDNLAIYKGITRNPASYASATVRFTLSEAMSFVVGIPQGTRVSAGSDLYFATDEYTEIPAGSTYADVIVTCQTAGIEGNGLLPGEINILVDPIPYMDNVSNVEQSSGGADIEDDESLAERIYLAPAKYSTAGPKDAYIEHTKSYSSSIGDVYVESPSACKVDVYVLLEDGSLPSSAIISEIDDYLNSKTIRPLTDQVTVKAPATTTYNINMTYYIAASDESSAVSIQTKVAAAIEEYKTWQTSTIGRDINPSELTKRVIEAGAKRCVITAPEFTAISASSVARTGTVSVTYGGIEDD